MISESHFANKTISTEESVNTQAHEAAQSAAVGQALPSAHIPGPGHWRWAHEWSGPGGRMEAGYSSHLPRSVQLMPLNVLSAVGTTAEPPHSGLPPEEASQPLDVMFPTGPVHPGVGLSGREILGVLCVSHWQSLSQHRPLRADRKPGPQARNPTWHSMRPGAHFTVTEV